MSNLSNNHYYNTMVIGITNKLSILNPSIRSVDRFDNEIEFNQPDENARLRILISLTRNMNLDKDVNLKDIAKDSHGFVIADLGKLIQKAGTYAISRYSNNKISQFEKNIYQHENNYIEKKINLNDDQLVNHSSTQKLTNLLHSSLTNNNKSSMIS